MGVEIPPQVAYVLSPVSFKPEAEVPQRISDRGVFERPADVLQACSDIRDVIVRIAEE